MQIITCKKKKKISLNRWTYSYLYSNLLLKNLFAIFYVAQKQHIILKIKEHNFKNYEDYVFFEKIQTFYKFPKGDP